MATGVKSDSEIEKIVQSIVDFINFNAQYLDPDNMCFRIAVNKIYRAKLQEYQSANPDDQISGLNIIGKIRSTWNQGDLENFRITDVYIRASLWVHNNDLPTAQEMLRDCLRRQKAVNKKSKSVKTKETVTTDSVDIDGPFDKRLSRLLVTSTSTDSIRIPFSKRYATTATGGYFANAASLKESGMSKKAQDAATAKIKENQNDPFFIGLPSMMNVYSITRLYGSQGGQNVINKRGTRKWYEIDEAIGENKSNQPGYSAVPTTSSLISWGSADPYERTPYHFTDFVFSKYWNRIENNRLITLRR